MRYYLEVIVMVVGSDGCLAFSITGIVRLDHGKLACDIGITDIAASANGTR